MKTAKGLINYCKKQVGLPYWFGTYGQVATRELLNSKKRQCPSYYTDNDFTKQIGKRVHDCSGLIKGYLMDGKYQSKYDLSAAALYACAKTKGKREIMPDEPGVLVFKGRTTTRITHVGVYIGGGVVIEAKGHKWGVVKSKLDNTWDYWAECHLISYSNKDEPTVNVPKIETASYFDKSMAGKYKVAASGLNLRAGAGTGKTILKELKNKTKVDCYGYYSKSGEDKWLYVMLNDGTVGFCSKKYLKKVSS